jgi:hypothetical protein
MADVEAMAQVAALYLSTVGHIIKTPATCAIVT